MNERKKVVLLVMSALLVLAGCTFSNSKEEKIGTESQEETEQYTSEEPVSEQIEEAATEEETSASTLTLKMVGDILLHTPVEESCQKADGSYDFSALFANVKEEVQAADVALVNQEVIIGGEELGISGYPAFNAPYEVADALVDTGFDVILHATNHAMDKGKRGITNCLANWETAYPDVNVVGINESQEAQDTITVLEENGIRIAILNYTYGLNEIELPSDMPYAVNLLEEKKVTDDIAKAKEESDFVIVCPHWGTEYRLQPDNMQEKWMQIFPENIAWSCAIRYGEICGSKRNSYSQNVHQKEHC